MIRPRIGDIVVISTTGWDGELSMELTKELTNGCASAEMNSVGEVTPVVESTCSWAIAVVRYQG